MQETLHETAENACTKLNAALLDVADDIPVDIVSVVKFDPAGDVVSATYTVKVKRPKPKKAEAGEFSE